MIQVDYKLDEEPNDAQEDGPLDDGEMESHAEIMPGQDCSRDQEEEEEILQHYISPEPDDLPMDESSTADGSLTADMSSLTTNELPTTNGLLGTSQEAATLVSSSRENSAPLGELQYPVWDDPRDWGDPLETFDSGLPEAEYARLSVQLSVDAAQDTHCAGDADATLGLPFPIVDERCSARLGSGELSCSNGVLHKLAESGGDIMHIQAVSIAPQQRTPPRSTLLSSPMRPSLIPTLDPDVLRPASLIQPKVEIIDLLEDTLSPPRATGPSFSTSPVSAHSADINSFLRSLEVPLEHFTGAFESMGFKTDAHLALLSRTQVMWDLLMGKLQREYGATVLDCVSIADGLNARRSDLGVYND
ncbi:hypothetical protein OBBRIDRAFT_832999 [Obba rivulosa]|uniref:Uncharacterized protein n=1 Tax=Obba rivulosa TaxID=1052685 RepID=A0A8E2AYP4_9APHY|nr:hypothetical protein OBBRIDRAFT_832999 [Obba rivulosa]